MKRLVLILIFLLSFYGMAQGDVSGHIMKRAKISAASSGANEVVAAVTGKKIKVLSVVLVSADAVNVKFQSASTDITGLMTLDAAGSGFVLPAPTYIDNYWFETSAGEALNLNLSGAVQVSGCITYYEE